MKRTWRAGVVGVVGWLGLAVLSGCGGSGEMFYLDVKPRAAAAQFDKPEPLKIVIEPFEDRRMERSRVGMRTHLWGGVTYFDLSGGKPSDQLAQALTDMLKNRGWHERTWNVAVVPVGSGPISNADIVITGQVIALSVNAKSRPFSTKITTESKVIIRAQNAVDRSIVTRSVESGQSDTVFWFSTQDVRDLLAATIKDTLERYIADTKIENGALRPTQ